MPAAGLQALPGGMVATFMAARGLLPTHTRPPATQTAGTPLSMCGSSSA